MKTAPQLLHCCAAILFLIAATDHSKTFAQPQTNPLAVRNAMPGPSVVKKYNSAGRSAFVERIADVLNSQIAESLNAKHFFEVIPQLENIPNESDRPVIRLNEDNPSAPLKSGTKYLLTVTMTDLDDHSVSLGEGKGSSDLKSSRSVELNAMQIQLQALQNERNRVSVQWQNTPKGREKRMLHHRVVQLDVQITQMTQRFKASQSVETHVDAEKQTNVKLSLRLQTTFHLYDGIAGKQLMTDIQSFAKDTTNSVVTRSLPTAESSEDLLLSVSHSTAQWIADSVFENANPAAILEKNGDLVTINRGQNSGVKVGYTYTVSTVGKIMIPTGGVTDQIPVGRIRIESVNPDTAKARILEDSGIVPGAILKRPGK